MSKTQDSDIKELIRNNLIFLRKHHGFTQDQLSKALGISIKSVRAYHEGRAMPPISVLMKIVKVFGVEYRELLETDLSKQSTK